MLKESFLIADRALPFYMKKSIIIVRTIGSVLDMDVWVTWISLDVVFSYIISLRYSCLLLIVKGRFSDNIVELFCCNESDDHTLKWTRKLIFLIICAAFSWKFTTVSSLVEPFLRYTGSYYITSKLGKIERPPDGMPLQARWIFH